MLCNVSVKSMVYLSVFPPHLFCKKKANEDVSGINSGISNFLSTLTHEEQSMISRFTLRSPFSCLKQQVRTHK